VLDAYARWAATYPAEAHNALMRLEQQMILDLLPDVSGKTVLDLACGSGRYLKKLLDLGSKVPLGLDVSPEMLRRARQLTANLVRGDLLHLPFQPRSFEVVTCGVAVGYVRDLSGALAEMSRVLTPGGVVVYSDFHPFAHLSGEKRSFRANGREYAVEHHAHLYSAHHVACRAANLDIEDVRESPDVSGSPPGVLAIRARRRPLASEDAVAREAGRGRGAGEGGAGVRGR